MPIKIFSNSEIDQTETDLVKEWLNVNQIPFVLIDLNKSPEYFDYVVNKLKFTNMPVVDIGGLISFRGYSKILLDSNKELMIKLINQ